MKRLLHAPARLFGVILFSICLITVMTVISARDHLHWGVGFNTSDTIKTSVGSFKIEAIDLTPEPGEFSSDEDLKRFYSRQGELEKVLAVNAMTVESANKDSSFNRKIFSVSDLPVLFWIQVIVGIGASIISGWVWSLRPRSIASLLFFVSGLSTLCFTYSAAIYTTRELALPVETFKLLVGLNVIGASLFGISTMALFLVYPLRIKHSIPCLVFLSVVFGLWTVLSVMGVLPAWAGVNLITFVEMIGIVVAIAVQFFMSSGRPKERAALAWLGLSILIGAGGFITLNALPLVFGIEIPMAQAYAFLFFLAFYLGLAAGIGKYRLFDVGGWAYKFLFYSVGAGFLVLLDVAFVTLLNLERLPALGLAFFVVGFFYLPLRDWVRGFIRKESILKPHDLIKEALFVVLSPNSLERKKRWEQLIRRSFNPVEVSVNFSEINNLQLLDDGTTLLLPSVGNIPSYTVKHPNGGKSLFNKDNLSMMDQLIKFIEHGDASRSTYERGVKEERKRIAQDLHDDVGARLLTGLHAPEADLRSTIQGAITDIRTIVKGIAGEATEFSHFFAELRVESLRRADASGLRLHWPLWGIQENFKIDYQTHKTISSIIREIISNSIKHANAGEISVRYSCDKDMIEFCIEDDGRGLSVEELNASSGQGIKNMKSRVEALGGELHISNLNSGTRIIFKIPLSKEKVC